MSAITAFFLTIFFVGYAIRFFRKRAVFQPTRREDDCPALGEWHQEKRFVPTLGGVFMHSAFLLSILLWADIRNPFVLWIIFIVIYMGIVGLADDLLKLKHASSKGIRKRTKLISQLVLGALIGIWLYSQDWFFHGIYVPFFKNVVLDLGIGYIFFAMLVIAGASNAVNLTDGMDGLAIGCSIMVVIAYVFLSYIAGNVVLSSYLYLPYVPGAGELAVVCAALFGVGIGYLWYNAFPAQIFMGDVGSLVIGAVLGAIALFVKQSLLLVIFGGVFVVEAVSVILQVGSFRFFGKRIFRVAPIHHHFQVKGTHEVKVVIRLWIISGILVLLGLATLKLR